MKKLALKTETLRTLSGSDLDGIVGGLGHVKNPNETKVRHHKHKVQPTKTAHTKPVSSEHLGAPHHLRGVIAW